MNLLIKERASGKTTGLIYTSEATGYPIVTAYGQSHVQLIKDRAKEMGCTIPEPMTVQQLRERGIRHNPKYVLIDEVDVILEDALKEYLHCDVLCATLTDRIKEWTMVNQNK